MHANPTYYPIAHAHEDVFRSILRDLKANRSRRAAGIYVPEDLETELPLDDLYLLYSYGDRTGTFTISNFEVVGDTAIISFHDVAFLSGGGGSLVYAISGERVEYLRPEVTFMS